MKNYIKKIYKYAIALIVMVGVFLIYYNFFTGDISNVSLVIGENVDYSVHSEQEIEEAFEEVKRLFKFDYSKCELVELAYYQGGNNNSSEIDIDCVFICNRRGDGPGNIMGDGAMNCTNYYLKRVNGKWRFVEKGFR